MLSIIVVNNKVYYVLYYAVYTRGQLSVMINLIIYNYTIMMVLISSLCVCHVW